ncbi:MULTISPECIES: GNAT family N-acetyltransferase [Methylobacterium]|uniref:BioF2-like acetyltransferase domain-containing protein n=4 Tax=Pseudomonadota TaxID=1224 RepID=A0ABQ4STH3_9HYPH|nr:MULTISPECIES: GNAT family N-acetyltransferase [Methylobacterium]PIU06973.1 MAG: GNAT family N-acetyltransferase [Methylobacterium sp. CG09_land_8_20_14_0_10_71_15]PIU14200.1 MAG: GNAT family N-acetyltransferase [Methylobacterium sp. CG08_land_8_20_14_0_20_71_15]GBU18099.1 hypothetical protein AwMethylo_23140 [Methylobacterium sp.]GJE05079.1 hypothetical protein AOPFMNJM_0374 [Methylobacterium jeotgali]
MTGPGGGAEAGAPVAARRADLPGGLAAALCPLDPESPSGESPWHGEWSRLGREAFVENPFYEAEYARPAARAFGAGVGLLLVGEEAPEAGGRLFAAWPFRRVGFRWGLPLPVAMGWTHGFCAYGVPLLDRRDPARALAGLLAAPRALGLPPRLLMPNLPQAGPFAELLAAHQAGAGTRGAAYWPHARALLDLAGLDARARRDYLAHMPGSRRKKLRQGLARLEAGGALRFETLREPAGLAAGIESYIALEAAGWKGRAGTAIAGRPREIAFMREMVRLRGPEGLRIDRLLRVEEGAEAMLAASVLLTRGDTAWCLKIAHDEDEARHSPGVQLVHRLTQDILADGATNRVDSCAAAEYRLGEMFWTGRRAIAHRLIEADGGDRLFPLAAALERAREGVARLRARRAG